MIHLKKEKRRTKALVRDYIGKTVFLRREVSIPILRVGVQKADIEEMIGIYGVSIPILRVGVQHGIMLTKNENVKFQFPYCAWEFNNYERARYKYDYVSIPILRVGVQPY